MRKAFAYLRVSGKGQVSGDGFPRQRDAVARWAKANRVEIVSEFRDEGISGTKDSFDRPGLSDLMVAVRANGVRLILVERADRLARDLMIGEIILAEFRKLGVEVIAAESGVDLTVGDDDPTHILIRQVLGAVAQFEKSVTVQKLRAARTRMRRTTGRCEGRKPFGDRPGEADTLNLIVKLAQKPRNKKALTYEAIADQLNAEGIQTRYGKAWSSAAVFKILSRSRT